MDAQNNARSYAPSGQLVYNVNLLGEDLTLELKWLAHSNPEGFTRLVEALAEGNSAVSYTLLRRWGVRRC